MVQEYETKLVRNEIYQKNYNMGGSVTNKFLKIRINTLKDAPRDPKALEALLKQNKRNVTRQEMR
jgi:hypothetical protein